MDERVAKVVEFMLRNPNASLPESMGAVQLFSPLECANRSIQQQIRHAHKKAKGLVPESVATYERNSNLSPLTNPSVQSKTDSSNNNNASTNSNTSGLNASLEEDSEVASALLYLSTSPSQSKKVRKKRNASSLERVREIRLTAAQAQQKRVNDKKKKENYKKAFKEACLLYEGEKTKASLGKRKSAQECCNEIGVKYNTSISKRTVQQYVQHGMAGNSPKKKGPDGGIAPDFFKVLVQAYESFVRIKQINGESAGNTRIQLMKRMNQAMLTGSSTDRLFV